MTQTTEELDPCEPPASYVPPATVDLPHVTSAADEPPAEVIHPPTEPDAKPRVAIRLARPEDEPYAAGQHTILITLTLPPGNGPVLAGVRSHNADPIIGAFSRERLPAEIAALLEQHAARLPVLAAKAEAEKAKKTRKKAPPGKAGPASATAEKPHAKSSGAAIAPPKGEPAAIPQIDLFADWDARAAEPAATAKS